jgi:maltose/moltooligosaccharide transporter
MDAKAYSSQGMGLLIGGLAVTALVYFLNWYKGLYILSIGIAVYGVFQIIAAQRYTAGKISGMVEIIYDLRNMPKTMTQLALVTILTWFAMFCWFIYCTPAITSHIYGTSDTLSKAYNDGADWVGVLNSWYNGVAAVMAPLLPFMARKLGRVGTHVICLIIGGVGLAAMYVIKDPHQLLIPMTALGIAWASLLTMPYAILSSAVPHKKMGVYMGMFNLFIVIPQILASASLGLLVEKVFGGHSIYALVLGGIAMVAAGLLTVFVKDKMPDQALAPATGGGGH